MKTHTVGGRGKREGRRERGREEEGKEGEGEREGGREVLYFLIPIQKRKKNAGQVWKTPCKCLMQLYTVVLW